MYSPRGWSYSSSPRPAGSPSRRRPRRRLDLRVLRRLGPLPLVLALVGGLSWYHFLFPGFALDGAVVDAASGRPLAGARVRASVDEGLAGADGAFRLRRVKPPEVLAVELPGYVPATVRALLPNQRLVAQLQPVTLDVRVRDVATQQPIPDAIVSIGARVATAQGEGEFRLGPVRPDDRIVVAAPGYTRQELPYEGQASLEVALPVSLVGRVTDAATGRPLARAPVSVAGTPYVTDGGGRYELPARPAAGRVTAIVPGYRRSQLDLATQRGLDLRLQPNEVKALYLTYYAIGHPDYVRRMFELLDTTELNAVVIDVKGDRGFLAYRSGVPLADQIGANADPTIKDLAALLQALRERGVYTIARIVAFKDDLLARNGAAVGVDVAVKDRRDGQPWVDGEGLAWVDPFQPAVWDYNVALAREAIERGFDEVQFDYVRFPTDPAVGNALENAVYAQPSTPASRVEALRRFLARGREAVNAAGGFLGIDTYGYTTWWEDDGGIGQDLVALADVVDYISPMVYPSTFDAGLPGGLVYPTVVREPYEVVYESLKRAREKLAGKRAVIRPWLQYFDDYPWATGVRYDAPQIEAQKKAVADSGSFGWMLWDPANQYGRGGLAPKG